MSKPSNPSAPETTEFVTAVAIPVDDKSHLSNAPPTYSSESHRISHGQEVNFGSSPLSQETEREGICRKCRRRFERPIGVNSGQAQYFRCQECEGDRFWDIAKGTCAIC